VILFWFFIIYWKFKWNLNIFFFNFNRLTLFPTQIDVLYVSYTSFGVEGLAPSNKYGISLLIVLSNADLDMLLPDHLVVHEHVHGVVVAPVLEVDGLAEGNIVVEVDFVLTGGVALDLQTGLGAFLQCEDDGGGAHLGSHLDQGTLLFIVVVVHSHCELQEEVFEGCDFVNTIFLTYFNDFIG